MVGSAYGAIFGLSSRHIKTSEGGEQAECRKITKFFQVGRCEAFRQFSPSVLPKQILRRDSVTVHEHLLGRKIPGTKGCLILSGKAEQKLTSES